MADIKDSKNWGFETKQVHIGQDAASYISADKRIKVEKAVCLCLVSLLKRF